MKVHRFGLSALAFGLGLVLSTPRSIGASPPGLGSEPVSVRADHLELDLQQGTAQLRGAVQVRQGDWVLSSEQIEARYDSVPNLTWVRAQGAVTVQRKALQAQAGQAEWHVGQKRLELRGGVRLSQGKTQVEAEGLQMDLGTGKIQLQSVRGTISPESLTALGAGH